MAYLRHMRFFLHHLLGIVVLVAVSCDVQAQIGRKNLPSFDDRPYHFGFILSGNQSDFDYALVDNDSSTFKSVFNTPRPGFNLHLMGSYTLSRHWRVRFAPGLSFQDRVLTYTFKSESSTGSDLTDDRATEAVYLDVPVYLKWRTDRVNNVAAYALIGSKYSRDFQSQENSNVVRGNDNELVEADILRLKRGNLSADFGGGLDFFLPYFKFSIQMKTELGLRNVLVPDISKFASPLEYLRTRSFVVSFCFEG